MKYTRRRASKRAGGGYGPTRHGKHTRNPGWKHGSYWVECQRCGLDYRQEDIKTQWDGLIVCLSCWEPRHPQDFVRGVHDDMRPHGPENPVGNVDDSIVVVPPFGGGTFDNDLDSTAGAPFPAADPDSLEYIACAPEAANLNNLQVWFEANDTSAQWQGNLWTGALADNVGDTVGSVINKAYPVADFPVRGTSATDDMADGTIEVVGHDTAPSLNDFVGTDTLAWGFATVVGGQANIQTQPPLAGGDQYKPCLNKATRFWVFETPEFDTSNASIQTMVDDQGSPVSPLGGKRIYFDPTDEVLHWEYFNAGSNRETVDLWTVRGGGLPRWEILIGRINQDNAVEEVNFWRNGLHVATHISPFDPFNFAFSHWWGSLFPTPFPNHAWDPKVGEFLTYDRWLTNDEVNGVISYLSAKHGITVEGLVTCEGQEAAEGCT